MSTIGNSVSLTYQRAFNTRFRPYLDDNMQDRVSLCQRLSWLPVRYALRGHLRRVMAPSTPRVGGLGSVYQVALYPQTSDDARVHPAGR